MIQFTSAPAKAILFGEHAVVYGRPAIAIPLAQIRAKALIRAIDQPLTIVASDIDGARFQFGRDPFDPADPLAKMADLVVDHLQISTPKGMIRIESAIPIASGLGSGAAVSAALGRAIAALHDASIHDRDLNDLVYEVEKLHHGTPSGIDNTVVVYERPIYFVKGKPIEFVCIERPLQIVLADTGVASTTKAAVADVRGLFERQPEETSALFRNIGTLVDQARVCIAAGDYEQLGELMTENHRLLKALDVSLPALDDLVTAAIDAGALGAKLSGGGRGGNMIALVEDNTLPLVKERLLAAGATRVLSASVGGKRAGDDGID